MEDHELESRNKGVLLYLILVILAVVFVGTVRDFIKDQIPLTKLIESLGFILFLLGIGQIPHSLLRKQFLNYPPIVDLSIALVGALMLLSGAVARYYN